MKQRPRIYYTESQKKLMRNYWQKGDCSPADRLAIWSKPFIDTAHLGPNTGYQFN